MTVIGLAALETVANDSIERLLDRAFGTDRRQRTAYRLREGMAALPGLSLAALDDGILVGSIQCWPVLFSGDDNARVPLILVGPVAVEPAHQRDGIGRMLMHASLAQAGDAAMMLVGDPDYYDRFFSFTAAKTGAWRLPGPVERHRLLARGTGVPAAAGTIGPRVPVAA